MKAHRYLSLALTGALLLAAGGCGAGGNSSGAAPAADMAAPAAGSAVYANAGAPAEAQEGLPEFYTEEYRYLAENGFHAVSTAPLSTFAADVDTASYANLRRMLLSGQEVPADAVRIEELINYFHYDYPTPEDGAPFSVSAEIAPCPWNGDTLLLRLGLQAP